MKANSANISRRGMLKAFGAGSAAAALGLAGTPFRAFASNATIDVVHFFSGNDHPIVKVIDAFNARGTGVTAVSRQDGTTYEAIIQKAMVNIAAGRPPAVITMGWKLASFAKHNLGAVDLGQFDRAKSDILKNYKAEVLPLVDVEGATLGIPWALSTPLLYVNMDLWRQAGLDDQNFPQTVEELYPAIAKLKEATGKAGIIYEINEWLPQAFIQNAGGEVIDASGAPVMDSDAAVYGMERYYEPRRTGIWEPVTLSEMISAFQSGAVGAIVTSSARYSGIKAQSAFELKMVQMPGLQGHQRRMNSGGNFLSVLTQEAEQQQAALTFLEFCSTKEAQELWLETGYLNSTVHDIPVPAGQEAGYEQLASGLTAETIWPGERGLEALKAHTDWISRIVNGAVSVRDGMAESKKAVARLIG